MTVWLGGITLAWMLIECVFSLFAAKGAHSPAILAFGLDSVVEMLSGSVVLLQSVPSFPFSQRRANQTAGFLLFALSGAVTVVAIWSLGFGLHPGKTRLGMAVSASALIVMPGLAWLKKREARLSNNPALSADAVQSATCAYLAAVTLAGLGVNEVWDLPWFDPIAALAAVPLLFIEAKASWRGQGCGC